MWAPVGSCLGFHKHFNKRINQQNCIKTWGESGLPLLPNFCDVSSELCGWNGVPFHNPKVPASQSLRPWLMNQHVILSWALPKVCTAHPFRERVVELQRS